MCYAYNYNNECPIFLNVINKKYFPVSASVIVAIYNTDQWIKRCLDSLLNQSINNFEVLLIDDGSLDESSIICEEYSLEDSKFCVFHKLNGGVSSARQCGLVEANGEYIIHADPDDWTASVMLEHLLKKAKDTHADMVICDFWYVTPHKREYWCENPKGENHLDVFTALFQHLHGSCWNKLIRRSCYCKYNISFSEKLNYCEDLLINARLLQENIVVAYLNEPLIYYCCDFRESLTKFSKEEHYNKLRFLLEKLREYIYPSFQSQCLPHIEVKLAALALSLGSKEINDFSKSFPALKNNLNVCKHPILKLYLFLSFCGMAKIVSLWMRWHRR